jgi:hypothetical protein
MARLRGPVLTIVIVIGFLAAGGGFADLPRRKPCPEGGNPREDQITKWGKRGRYKPDDELLAFLKGL